MKRYLFLLMILSMVLYLGMVPAQGEADSGVAQDVPMIIADGDLSDWGGIWSLSPGEDKIAILYAFRSDTHLAIALQAPDTTDISIYDVVLDLDNDPQTGYRADGKYKSAGGDFLIETWTAGFYTDDPNGEEWAWKGDDYPIERAASKDNTAIELLIPLEVLNNPENIRMAVWANNKDWQIIGYAPPTGGNFIEVPYYKDVIGAPITQAISDIKLTLADDLRALGPSAMPGGMIGSLSASGGDGEHYDFAFKADASHGRDNHLFLIEGNVLKTNNQPLSPGTYKLSLQVSSLIRKETANLIVDISAQDPDTPITAEIFDGIKGQWYTVDYEAAKPLPNLNQLKAQTDGNRLWFFAAAENLGDDFTIYLGDEVTAGMDMGNLWPGALPAHKIMVDASVWAFENGGWKDSGKKASLHKTDKGVEGFVMAARLNNLAKLFTVAIQDGEGNTLPEQGQPMLEVRSPNRIYSPVIKADGSAQDWDDIARLTEGSGVVGDTFAARTEDYLYVLTHLSGIVDPEDDRAFSLNILVDVDGDKYSGFNHPGYPAHSGIDVLVQDWHSTNLELFIFQKPSTEWFSCVSRSPEGIKKAVKDLGEGNYSVEYSIPIKLLMSNVPEISDDFYLAVDREVDMQPGTSTGTAPQANMPGSALQLVPKYRTTVSHLDLNDNSFLDWDGVGGKAVPSAQAQLENLYATMSQDKLFVLITGLGMNAKYELNILTDKEDTWLIKDSKLLDSQGKFQRDVYSSIHEDHIALQVYLADLGFPQSLVLQFSNESMQQSLSCSRTFTMAKDDALFYPREHHALENKPYHGWAAWASVNLDDKIAQPFSTVFLDIKWDEFEPEKGNYSFDMLEEKYHLNYWKEQGVRFLLRFVMDDVVPTQGVQRMDIPAWLYEELAAENYDGLGEAGAGTFYDEPELLGGGGFSPNYKSPILLERHKLAIAALAKRFDDTAITAFVQVGSLGHWAEMHTWPDGTGEFPDPELVGHYMQAYSDAFKHIKLAARKPYPYASENNWGLYNDMFGDAGATDTFRDFFLNGCTDMPHASAAEVEASKMPDFWQFGYSGGEFAEGNVRKFIGDEVAAETLRLIRESHSSLIGPCSPTDLLEDDPDGHAYDVNLDAMRRQMGYQLSVESLTFINHAKAGENLNLEITWLNRGISPFYYPWPGELSLVEQGGKTVFTQLMKVNVHKLLPGRTVTKELLELPKDLGQGSYTLVLAILDMDSGKPALPLNMERLGDEFRYPLYQFEID